MNKPQKSNVFGALPIKVDLAEPKPAPTGDPEKDLQMFPVPPEELSLVELSPVELAPLPPLRTPHGPELVKGTSPNERRMKANAKGTKKKKQTETSLSMPARMSGDWIEAESFWRRRLYEALALAFTCSFMFVLYRFWAPAPGRPGIDENGYLVGGRNFAQSGTIGFKPDDNFEFVGAMWVRTKEEVKPLFPTPFHVRLFQHDFGTIDLDKKFPMLQSHTKEGWYYPKYPLGTSMLNAAAIKIGGEAHGRQWAFLVSPISVSLAVLGMFFLTRLVAGSFYGLLGMIVLATGYTTLELANIPSSHAPALVMVVLGIYFVIRWMQTGTWWRGMFAGLLLGYAVTIRYTEALLLFPLYPLDQVLRDTDIKDYHSYWWAFIRLVRFLPIGPLGIAALSMIRWRRVSSYFRASVPIISWGLVVGGLVAYNWFNMGSATGYDSTNESLGFSTKEFFSKWDFAIQQNYNYSNFLTLPLGLIGIGLMFRKSTRLGLVFLMWYVPGTLLYTAYYWGQNIQGIGYLRFFLTLLPALIVGTMWLMHAASIGGRTTSQIETANVASVASRSTGVLDYSNRSAPTRSPIITFFAWLLREIYRGTAAPLTAGLLVLAVGAMGLHISLPDMARQHRGNVNLSTSADRILVNSNKAVREAQRSVNRDREMVLAKPMDVLAAKLSDPLCYVLGKSTATNTRRTPTESLGQYFEALSQIKIDKRATNAVTSPNPSKKITPVVFMDAGIFPQHLQYMQFVCDGTWYTLDTFTPRIAGGFGLFAFGQAAKKTKGKKNDDNQDNAVLIQQARIDMMTDFLRDKTPANLLNMQKQAINNALASERPVFAVLTKFEETEFKKRITDNEYVMIELEQWVERMNTNPNQIDPSTDEESKKSSRRSFAMGPPQWVGAELIFNWQPQEYTMYEIRRQPSTSLRVVRALINQSRAALNMNFGKYNPAHNDFSKTFTTRVNPLLALPMNCWNILLVTSINSSM